MKSYIKNAVGRLELSSTAKARIKRACQDASESNERQYIKTARRGVRVAVLAACFCIFASVSAIAISELYPRISQEISGKDYSAYHITGDSIVCHDLSNFSSELTADLESAGIQRVFGARSELEEYIGIKLINSPALESAGIIEDLRESIKYNWNIDSAIIEYPDARYVLSAITEDGESVLSPSEIKISAHRVFLNSEIILTAHILTEFSESSDSNSILGMQFSPTAQMTHTPLMPDGNGGFTCQTEHFRSAEHEFETSTYTMKCGIEATVVTATDAGGAKDYFGHFIYNGVLYSVYPSAIYEPSQSYPNHNTDSYDILLYVLDTFEVPVD